MRKSVRLAAVVLLVLATVGIAPAGAWAVDAPPAPVMPVPDVPSRTVQMTKVNGTWTDVKTLQVWRGMVDWATKPGTTVATIPKPITPAAPLVRGATGAPLVSAFVGGFAIGQAGLQLYGQITGDDPLEGICGSGFEGVGAVIYMGMMPDCSAPVSTPNVDAPGGYADLKLNGTTIVSYKGSLPPVAQAPNYWSRFCYGYSGSTPTGYSIVKVFTNGTTGSGAPSYWTGSGCSTNYYHYGPDYQGKWPGFGEYSPGLSLKQNSTNQIVATMTKLSTNPKRTPNCRIEWEDGTQTTANGLDYHEDVGIPLSSTGLGCEQAYVSKPGAGPDLLPERISVHSSSEDGAITQIVDSPVPEMSPEQRRGLDANITRGLVLEKTVNGVVDSCMTWAADCAQWWDDPAKTSNYRCTFNGAVITLDECGVYRNTFNERTATPTITDPETGNQAPWESSSPSNTTNPGTGPTPGEACMSEWSSAPNPIDWILHPIKCALVWAFVPRDSVVVSTQTALATAWAPTIFGRLPDVVGTALTIPDGGSGCSGPLVAIPLHLGDLNVDYQGYPLSACEAPMSVLADWSRLIGSAVIIWLTGLGIIRRASATVNAPGIGGGAA